MAKELFYFLSYLSYLSYPTTSAENDGRKDKGRATIVSYPFCLSLFISELNRELVEYTLTKQEAKERLEVILVIACSFHLEVRTKYICM